MLGWDPIENTVAFELPKDVASGYVNNQRGRYEFKFTGILGPDSNQEEVFDRLARDTIDASLEGMNGTIFAYGQTGAGNTFTITGGGDRYVDRGILPRTLSTIYKEINKRNEWQYSVAISYMEIYKESGYDLLDPNKEVKDIDDLPKVNFLEDENGHLHFRNLSVNPAPTEEEALSLLFMGDVNRAVSSTAMNQASSRSHCIFTVYLTARKPGSDTMRRSKLTLVDLAGSERVSKTQATGGVLKEAMYINGSLHALEQVIIGMGSSSTGMQKPGDVVFHTEPHL